MIKSSPISKQELKDYLVENLKIKLKHEYFDYGSDGEAGKILTVSLLLDNKVISKDKLEYDIERN